LWTGFASGEMSAGERHVRLQRLRQLDDGERGLLANARCLSEGVDVPTLDGVAFIDPRGSEVDIVQAVGRAIRLADDKTVGTIVIPVFVDTETDPDTALNDSSFKSVWRVIKALRAHDEELAEQIDTFRRELGRNGGRVRIPDKIHLDVARSVGKAFTDAFDVRLVEKTSARWEFWFGLLEQYADDNGTARVPVDYVMDGYPLGQWASVQRGFYTRGTLSEVRQGRLERLPGWTWNILADQTWSHDLAARAQSHFDRFGLQALYAYQANRQVAGIRHRLAEIFTNQGFAGVRQHLDREAASWQKGNANSWEAALYAGLAASTWFCSGGFQFIGE